jgi:Ca2+-binding RTX toxin-like protein
MIGDKPSPKPRHKQSRRLGLETLDARINPTTAALGLLEGDYLNIVGDDNANTVVLRQDAARNLSIDGGIIITEAGPRTSIPAASLRGITIITGGGNDRVFIHPSITASLSIDLGEGNDFALSGGGFARIFAGPGDDIVRATTGNTTFYGNSGNDTFIGGAGFDIAYTGLGRDRLFAIESRPDFVTSVDTLLPSAPATDAFPTTIVAPATPTLGAFREPTTRAAFLDGDALVLQGTGGVDTLSVRLVNGQIAMSDGSTIRTDAGFVGSLAASRVSFVTVLGYSGDDRIDLGALTIPSVIVGGAGNGTINATNASDLIFGGPGNDWVGANRGDDAVYGGSGDDVIFTHEGRDTIYGAAGNDRLEGGDGDDFIFAGAGNDLAYGMAGNDVIFLGAGDDQGFGGDGNDLLLGEAGNDALYGEAGADELDGGIGADLLGGGAGDDSLRGGEGADTIFGEAGFDRSIGTDAFDLFPWFDVEQFV